MVAGEIGFRVVGGYPGMMLCDGSMTVWNQYQTQETFYVPVPTIYGNGQIIYQSQYDSTGHFLYNHALLAYNGVWWRTANGWVNDSGVPSGVAIFEARVLNSGYVNAYFSGAHRFPALVVQDVAGARWWNNDWTGITVF